MARTSATSFGISGSVSSWQSITATTKNMVAGEGYISTSTANAQLVYALPATANVGDIFAVVGGSGTGGWKINANTGQTIKQSGNTTTVAGSLTSGTQYDGVEIICIVANTLFLVRNAQGSFTIA